MPQWEVGRGRCAVGGGRWEVVTILDQLERDAKCINKIELGYRMPDDRMPHTTPDSD
jgi:hypothetical protein